MATKEEAKQALQSILGRKKDKFDFRFAITGDGNGAAASNFFHPTDNNYAWVRDINNLDRPYPVLNRGRVRPAVNMPVIIGRNDIEPEFEQILGVNYDALPAGLSGSAIQEIGAHHTQHEWDGGDEVFIDSRQFLPGLVYPTKPESMKVEIKPFTFFHGEWKRSSSALSPDFSASAPSGGDYRYVLISLDPSNLSHIYTRGNADTILLGDPIDIQNRKKSLAQIPDPRPNDIPLGALYLTASTTAIGWNAVDNILDARLHLDKAELATANGQVAVSVDGISFSPKMPVTEKAIGQQLMDEDSGLLIFA